MPRTPQDDPEDHKSPPGDRDEWDRDDSEEVVHMSRSSRLDDERDESDIAEDDILAEYAIDPYLVELGDGRDVY